MIPQACSSGGLHNEKRPPPDVPEIFIVDGERRKARVLVPPHHTTLQASLHQVFSWISWLSAPKVLVRAGDHEAYVFRLFIGNLHDFLPRSHL